MEETMKTTKRVLSCILAVLLVVAALPLSASAANKGSMTLKLVEFAAATDPESPYEGSFDVTGGESGELAYRVPDGTTKRSPQAADLQKTVTALNNAIVPTSAQGAGTQSSPYQIAKGSTFYLVVDINAANASAGGFTTGTTPVVQFTKDAFTVTGSMAHPAVSRDHFGGGTSPATGGNNYMPGATGFTLGLGEYANEQDKDGNATDRFTLQLSGGTGYIPNAANWDVALRLTASGSAGVYKVEIAPEENNSNASQVTAVAYNEDGWKTGSTYDVNNVANDGTTVNDITFSDPIYIEIISNDPKISITANQKLDPVDTAKVAVTLKNGTWASTLNASDFVLVESGTEQAGTVLSVARTSDTVATLTVKGSGLDATKNYSVKAKAATHTATSSDPTADITTAETFTVKEKLTGTVTLAANNSHGTSPVYGDTITATYSGNVVTAKYQWKVGGVNKGTDSATYTPAAADVTKTITCTVTDKGTNAKFGSVDSAATTALAKKTLTAPVAADITNVPAIKQGATTLTANGTYTFKTSNGLVGTDTVTVSYVATYQSSANKGQVNDVSVALGNTLAGAQKDAYTFAGATVPGVKGEVSEAKYTLTTTGGSATYAGDNVTGTTVSNLGGKVTGTVSAAALDGGVLSDVTITGATVTGKSITNDGANGSDATFEFTLPATTDVVSVTVALTIGKGVTTVAFDSLNKTYDGTTDFKGELATAGVTLEDFGITAIEYASADAGTGVTINVTPDSALGKEITKGEDTFKFPAALTGDITKAAATTITAAVPSGKIPSNADLAKVLEVVKAAPVKADDISAGTVGDYMTDENITDALKALGEPIYTAATPAVEGTVNDVAATTALAGQTITTLTEGDTYTFASTDAPKFFDAEGNEVTEDAAIAALGFTVGTDDDGNITVTVGKTAVPGGTQIKSNSDANVITFGSAGTDVTPAEAKPATEAVWDFSSKAGQSISLNLTLATADGATVLGKNFEDVAGKTLAVTVPINSKGQPVTSGISFDTKGYGKASFDTADVNSDGLIDALPTVTDVVKGAEFVGWSEDGTVAKIVDIKTYKPEDGQTLYAAFRGYMVGDGNGKVRPAASVTRAELVKMLVVAAGLYDSTKDYGKPTFTDVGNAWYTSYIACAEQAKIALGDGNGKFRPNDKITREEASILIAKAFGVEIKEGATTDKVSDFDKVSSWAKDYVAALCNNGTINGYTDGTFRAGSNIKRMESATMTNHYLGLTDAEKETIKTSTDIKNPFTDINTDDTKWAYADLMFASLSVPATFYGTEITMPEAK